MTTCHDFMKHRRLCLVLTALILLTAPALVALVGLVPALDFTGGTEVLVRMPRPLPDEEARRRLARIPRAGLQRVVAPGGGETWSIRLQVEPRAAAAAAARAAAALGGERPAEVLAVTSIGPVVGQSARRDALRALAGCAVGLLAYMWLRFDLAGGLAALAALAHAAAVVLAVLAVARVPVDIGVVTAVLTVLGYSLNDSIVILDRMRELSVRGVRDRAALVNRAISDCLGRTIVTGTTVLIALAALGLAGPPALSGFALAMTVGVVSGTVSTWTVVCPLLARRG
jgi:preprotein translocase SecF subunit